MARDMNKPCKMVYISIPKVSSFLIGSSLGDRVWENMAIIRPLIKMASGKKAIEKG